MIILVQIGFWPQVALPPSQFSKQLTEVDGEANSVTGVPTGKVAVTGERQPEHRIPLGSLKMFPWTVDRSGETVRVYVCPKVEIARHRIKKGTLTSHGRV